MVTKKIINIFKNNEYIEIGKYLQSTLNSAKTGINLIVISKIGLDIAL